MNFNITINLIRTYFRKSTNEWVCYVNAHSEYGVSLSVDYTGATLEEAKQDMLDNLANDLLKVEIEYRKDEVLALCDKKIEENN